MTVAEFDRMLEGIELQDPTIADCAELHAMIRERAAAHVPVDVTLRGTPDRKHDGEHRVEVVVGMHDARCMRTLRVMSAA